MADNMKIIKYSLDSPSFPQNLKASISIILPLTTDFAGFVAFILSATTASFNAWRFIVRVFHVFASTIVAVSLVFFVVFLSVCLVLD